MTKAAAFHTFFSSFGLDAYEENSVYSLEGVPAFPYLTYEVQTDVFGDYDAAISASLWYRTRSSWREANAKVEEISKFIGDGKMYEVDGGYILFMRGSPFSQNMQDISDTQIKRKVLNFRVRFYTND